MPLVSSLFKDDSRLQRCLTTPSAHVQRGDIGVYVAKIQQALILVNNANIAINEINNQSYGPTTSGAVVDYKSSKSPPINNFSYETTVDAIVGQLTIKALDDDLAISPQPGPSPQPPLPPQPGPSPLPPPGPPQPPQPPSPPPKPPPPRVTHAFFDKPATFRGDLDHGFLSSQRGFYHRNDALYRWQSLPLEAPDNVRNIILIEDQEVPLVVQAVSDREGGGLDGDVSHVFASDPQPTLPQAKLRGFNLTGKGLGRAALRATSNGKFIAKLHVRVFERKFVSVALFRGIYHVHHRFSADEQFTSNRSQSDADAFIKQANSIFASANLEVKVKNQSLIDLDIPFKPDSGNSDRDLQLMRQLASAKVDADFIIIFTPPKMMLDDELGFTSSAIMISDRAPPFAPVVAHELGHAMGLSHVPSPDPNDNKEAPSQNLSDVINLMSRGVTLVDNLINKSKELNAFQCAKLNLARGSFRELVSADPRFRDDFPP